MDDGKLTVFPAADSGDELEDIGLFFGVKLGEVFVGAHLCEMSVESTVSIMNDKIAVPPHTLTGMLHPRLDVKRRFCSLVDLKLQGNAEDDAGKIAEG